MSRPRPTVGVPRLVLLAMLVLAFAPALVASGCGGDDSEATVGPDRTGAADVRGGGGGRGDGVDAGGTGGADAAATEDAAGVDDGGGSGGHVPEDWPPDPPDDRTGEVLVEPESVYRTAAGPGDFVEETVSIANLTSTEVLVHATTFTGGDPGFALRDPPVGVRLAPDETVEFGVQYTSDGAEEAHAEVLIEHELGAIRIPVTIAQKAAEPVEGSEPCVTIAPRSLDFGTVTRGVDPPVNRSFTVENCGEGPIRIFGFERARVLFIPTPDAFQWTHEALPLDLAPGASTTVDVEFTPGRAGVQQGAIEVRTNVSGSERVRVDLRARTEPPPISELDVHLVLRWDVSGGSDVDFHFLAEGAELFSCDDCYFASMSPDWGVAGDLIDDPFLDIDDLEGPGPENINVDELADGRYRIVVHYYSDTGSGGGGGDGFGTAANATVEVYLGGTLAATYGPTRLSSTDQTWDVATLDWPSGTLTEDGRVYDLGSRGSCGGF